MQPPADRGPSEMLSHLPDRCGGGQSGYEPLRPELLPALWKAAEEPGSREEADWKAAHAVWESVVLTPGWSQIASECYVTSGEIWGYVWFEGLINGLFGRLLGFRGCLGGFGAVFIHHLRQ